MSNTSTAKVAGAPTTRIYGCGGAGINAVNRFIQSGQGSILGTIDGSYAFLDTSRANLPSDADESKVYVPNDTKGSGKKRGENYDAIKASFKDILLKQEPGEYNIVVFSLSGGSGSVIGPVIMAELLARKLPTVAVVIASTESGKETLNTIDTLLSLDGIRKARKLPVVMCYAENEESRTFAEVDQEVTKYITALTMLFNNVNTEMDFKDLRHLVQFNDVVDVEASLCTLDFFSQDQLEENRDTLGSPVAVASLYRTRDDRKPLRLGHDYNAVGVLSTEFYDKDNVKLDQVHYLINTDTIEPLFKRLKSVQAENKSKADARTTRSAIASDADGADDLGMVI